MNYKFYMVNAVAFAFLLASSLSLTGQVIYQYGFENECGNQLYFCQPLDRDTGCNCHGP